MQEIPDGLVAVGRLHSPHGLSGELKAECLSWNPDRFRELSSVVLVRSGVSRDAKIVRAVSHSAGWRLSFQGISDPETAKMFSGSWICVPEGQSTRPEGGWIEADLVDMPVVDASGAVLGKGMGLADLPTQSVRVISSQGAEIILPMEGPLACAVDVEGHRIVVDRDVWDALA